jgi:uncharacterized membrane protein
MSRNYKKSMVSTVVLILLGIVALFAGLKSLILLVPIAVAIWFGNTPMLRSGRN